MSPAPAPAVTDDEATIVVTGMGAVSALGTGCGALAEALRQGRDGLRATHRFATETFTSSLAGTWPAWDDRVQPDSADAGLQGSASVFPALEMALAAAREAWTNARLPAADTGRVALLLGTCFGEGFARFGELTEALASALGLRGPCLTLSTACSSSTNAIGLGRDLLTSGRADVVVAGGVDVLLREVFAGFAALGVLSPGKCAPWSEPRGTTLAEGAGFVVLERVRDARRRGAEALCTIDGHALSADAHHETSPDPTGSGLERAIRWALADAGAPASAIEHVNAHATGTEGNDRTEWEAIARALGPRPVPVPVSGLKSFLGHAMGAAGVLELILAVLAMREHVLPPTLHFTRPRPGAPPDPVPAPRPGRVRQALDISAAFGGANAVLVYGAPDREGTPRRGRDPVPVVVRGLGAVSSAGVGLPALARAVAAGVPVAGRAPGFDLAAIVPTADPRRLDPSSRLLTAAAGLAMRDAALVLRGERRDQTGLFLAAARMPAESSIRCQESLDRHGPAGMSAAAFARMSVNAPAGACCKHLSLRGPCTTVSIGAGSGLFGIAYAADWLARRQDARALLAGAVDEAPARPEVTPAFEGATAVVLERAPADLVEGDIVVAGWALGGPDDLAGTAREALVGDGSPDGLFCDGSPAAVVPLLAGRTLPLGICDVAPIAAGETCASSLAFALAVLALRERRARSLLVLAARSRSASVAVLLRRSGR